MNIENESDDFLNKMKGVDESSVVNKIPEEDITPFTLWIKNELQPYVTKVILSNRLLDTPILITSQVSATMKTLMAMMQQEKVLNYDNFIGQHNERLHCGDKPVE